MSPTELSQSSKSESKQNPSLTSSTTPKNSSINSSSSSIAFETPISKISSLPSSSSSPFSSSISPRSQRRILYHTISICGFIFGILGGILLIGSGKLKSSMGISGLILFCIGIIMLFIGVVRSHNIYIFRPQLKII